MADEPGASGGSGNNRKIALVAGLGLIGLGAYQLTRKPGSSGSGSGGLPATGKRIAIATWLGVCRADVVTASQQGRWTDVLGQYLREQWPDFLSRSDIGGNAGGLEVQGQWLREAAASFWNRADIQGAWFGVPPRKSDVIGQYLRENGALNCTSVSAPGGGGGVTPTPTQLPQSGRPAVITDAMQLPPGCIIATDCSARAGRAWFIESANAAQGVGRSGRPLYRWKRLIGDNQAWLALGDPWRAIRLVTSACRDELANGPDLRTNTGGFGPIQTWAWANGAPLNGVINSIAGYCT